MAGAHLSRPFPPPQTRTTHTHHKHAPHTRTTNTHHAHTRTHTLHAGPGLAVRVLGDVTANDALDTLRQVDEVFIDSIREWGLYDKIWQAFAVFLPVRSVGGWGGGWVGGGGGEIKGFGVHAWPRQASP
jgi:hypothetical protein